MENALSEENEPSNVIYVDFSARRLENAAYLDFRELAYRMADRDEHRAIEHDRKADRLFLGSLAVAGVTAGLDLLIGQTFHMRQLLLGENVHDLSQQITHGVVLALGGIPTAIGMFKGVCQSLDADSCRRVAAWTRQKS